MSREELADAVNAALDRVYPDGRLASQYVDARWVGKLERGEHRWPSLERRAALRLVFGVLTDDELGLYSPRRSEDLQPNPPVHVQALAPGEPAEPAPSRTAAPQAAQRSNPESTSDGAVVEFLAVLERRGTSTSDLTAAELTADHLDQQFASLGASETLSRVRMLLSAVLNQLRMAQSLAHHRRLVALAARLAGLHAWGCFDIDRHNDAQRWYAAAVSAAEESEAWGLCGWLLGGPRSGAGRDCATG
jgi:hypothetical protein